MEKRVRKVLFERTNARHSEELGDGDEESEIDAYMQKIRKDQAFQKAKEKRFPKSKAENHEHDVGRSHGRAQLSGLAVGHSVA